MKSEDRQHSAQPLQIDSGAETGLVNLGRRFKDRMLLMIGNFSVRYVRASFHLFVCVCVCVQMVTTDLNVFIARDPHWYKFLFIKKLNEFF